MSVPSQSQQQIPDLLTGKKFLSRIPLADQRLAFGQIAGFLDSLLVSPLDTDNVFELLEDVSQPIASIAKELAKHYLDKPIPLGNIEESFFQQVSQLCLKMAKAYAYCAEKSLPDPDDHQSAILLHRCIHFTGIVILEYQRARREVPWGLWLKLHEYYNMAEELKLATFAIPDVFDPQSPEDTTHCAATYTAFILCDMAGSYNLTLHDQAMVRRWAVAWSPLTSLHSFALGESLPQFVVNLVHDTALHPATESLNTDQLRRLDVSPLADWLRKTREKLKQRASPSQLGLGDDCTSLQCSRLLKHLTRQWSQGRAARKYRRHSSSGTTYICSGFEEMHFFISGSEFHQPDNVRIYSRQGFDRRFGLRTEEILQQPRHFNQENFSTSNKVDMWEVVNQSANGFCLVRSTNGQRMVYRQLLALRLHDSEHCLLAQVVWLVQEHKGGLIAGVAVLPGLPTAICFRHGEKSGEPYQRAFLLPAQKAANVEPSLILPTGWYRPGQTIEIFDKEAQTVRLKGLLENGPGFDHAEFEFCKR